MTDFMLLKARSEFPHSVVKALHAIILKLRNFMLRNDDVDLLALRYTLVTLGDFSTKICWNNSHSSTQ